MKTLTIGKVTGLAGVGVETVRFYEREGLIEQPSRRKSGYRHYPQEAVSRIRFIKRAKYLGFSLKEIKELLELRNVPGTTCRDIKVRAQAKIADIEDKIYSLQRIKKALEELSAACLGNGSVNECSILEALDQE